MFTFESQYTTSVKCERSCVPFVLKIVVLVHVVIISILIPRGIIIFVLTSCTVFTSCSQSYQLLESYRVVR